HDELTRAHHAESRTYFVAKLGLNVVEVDRELLVALELLARDVCDDLFRRWLNDEVALVPILEAQKLWPVLVPATGFLPQLRGLNDRHQQLDGAGAIHFFTHHGFDLAQHPHAERQPGVDAAREPLDHARAQHQSVADEL